jgi:unsaturated rhamnogalacturonyl hydrolase
MNDRIFFLQRILLIVIITFPGVFTYAQHLPSQKDIIKKMEMANDYFMRKWPDPGKPIVADITRPSNIWTRGVYYNGLMAFYKISPQQKFYDYAVQWGEKHKWGLRDGPYTRNADNQCCGQTYLQLYQIDPKPERIRDIKLCIDSMVKSEKKDDWNWIDALQMAMPVFARLGVICKDNAYYEKMYDLYYYTKTRHGTNGLYNPADHLWWRDQDYDPPYKEPNGEDCYWSRGNGRVFAAMANVLEIMPADAPHRDEYQKTFVEMANALAPIQRKDGFWNVSLHDPTNFGGKELSGTALIVYGMAWGVNNGILPKKTYQHLVAKAWNAMAKEGMHPSGFLGYVQGTGKEPSAGQPVKFNSMPDFQDYALGCFLLAGSEVFKLKD